ncbi:microtubule-associated protein 2-like [Ylistrum balloti]|uniref:microtubule-associated protein 2-like n=1 Tax=Ylistrum balloti TaxID=509963 RepID=UPI002905A977|nr:microtubule-associated protein 2-like [Ylistrum balloti]
MLEIDKKTDEGFFPNDDQKVPSALCDEDTLAGDVPSYSVPREPEIPLESDVSSFSHQCEDYVGSNIDDSFSPFNSEMSSYSQTGSHESFSVFGVEQEVDPAPQALPEPAPPMDQKNELIFFSKDSDQSADEGCMNSNVFSASAEAHPPDPYIILQPSNGNTDPDVRCLQTYGDPDSLPDLKADMSPLKHNVPDFLKHDQKEAAPFDESPRLGNLEGSKTRDAFESDIFEQKKPEQGVLDSKENVPELMGKQNEPAINTMTQLGDDEEEEDYSESDSNSQVENDEIIEDDYTDSDNAENVHGDVLENNGNVEYDVPVTTDEVAVRPMFADDISDPAFDHSSEKSEFSENEFHQQEVIPSRNANAVLGESFSEQGPGKQADETRQIVQGEMDPRETICKSETFTIESDSDMEERSITPEQDGNNEETATGSYQLMSGLENKSNVTHGGASPPMNHSGTELLFNKEETGSCFSQEQIDGKVNMVQKQPEFNQEEMELNLREENQNISAPQQEPESEQQIAFQGEKTFQLEQGFPQTEPMIPQNITSPQEFYSGGHPEKPDNHGLTPEKVMYVESSETGIKQDQAAPCTPEVISQLEDVAFSPILSQMADNSCMNKDNTRTDTGTLLESNEQLPTDFALQQEFIQQNQEFNEKVGYDNEDNRDPVDRLSEQEGKEGSPQPHALDAKPMSLESDVKDICPSDGRPISLPDDQPAYAQNMFEEQTEYEGKQDAFQSFENESNKVGHDAVPEVKGQPDIDISFGMPPADTDGNVPGRGSEDLEGGQDGLPSVGGINFDHGIPKHSDVRNEAIQPNATNDQYIKDRIEEYEEKRLEGGSDLKESGLGESVITAESQETDDQLMIDDKAEIKKTLTESMEYSTYQDDAMLSQVQEATTLMEATSLMEASSLLNESDINSAASPLSEPMLTKSSSDEYTEERRDEEENSKEKTGEEKYTEDRIKEKEYTDNRIEEEEYTKDRIEEEEYTQDRIEEEEYTQDRIEEEEYTQDRIEEEEYTQDRIEEEEYTKDRIEEKEYTKDRIEEEEYTKDRIEKEEYTKDRIVEEEYTQDRIEEEEYTKDRIEEEEYTKGRIEEEEYTQDRIEEGNYTKDRIEEEEYTQDRIEEVEYTKDRIEEEEYRKDRIEEYTQDRIEEEQYTKDRIEEEEYRKDRIEEEEYTKDRIEEEEYTQDRIEEEEYTQDRIEEEEYTKDRIEEEEYTKDRIEEEEYTQDRIEKEEYTQDRIEKEEYTQDRIEEEKYMQDRIEEEKNREGRIEEKEYTEEGTRETKGRSEQLCEVAEVEDYAILVQKQKSETGDEDIRENKMDTPIVVPHTKTSETPASPVARQQTAELQSPVTLENVSSSEQSTEKTSEIQEHLTKVESSPAKADVKKIAEPAESKPQFFDKSEKNAEKPKKHENVSAVTPQKPLRKPKERTPNKSDTSKIPSPTKAKNGFSKSSSFAPSKQSVEKPPFDTRFPLAVSASNQRVVPLSQTPTTPGPSKVPSRKIPARSPEATQSFLERMSRPRSRTPKKDGSSDSAVEDRPQRTASATSEKKKYGIDAKPGSGNVKVTDQKVPSKHVGSKVDARSKTPTGSQHKYTTSKSPRVPTPDTKRVQSKIGSLANTTHTPGGGNVKISNQKVDFSTVQGRIGSKANLDHRPKGGDKKILSQKLEWKAESRVGSLDNAKHAPGGGKVKITNEKVAWKRESRIGSLDNMKHSPGGGDVKIETAKLDFKEKAASKVGSKDNIDHKAGGGDKRIETRKLDFKDKATSKVGSKDNASHKPKGGDKKIESYKLTFKESAKPRTDTGSAVSSPPSLKSPRPDSSISHDSQEQEVASPGNLENSSKMI